MSSIDERIVEMKFNNAQFEKNVSTTQTSLQKLKEGLKLDGAKKGLDDLSAAGKNFTLGSIGAAVEGIAAKFTTLGIIGITVLTNLANKAVNAGLAMAKSLTIDPIKQGFDEYELKLGSIQTILANTSKHGTTLSQVTASLDELNNYADKTIYNFGAMTKNIGLFTNAGIKIEDATSMIKGFSNEAAASGTSAEGAAGAAYQLSQALSAGKITLMDWRSLQNVGMGNANMKTGILDIATALGTLEGKGVTATDIQKDFNGSLEKGWLTADVMSTYLKIMAGDMDASAMAAAGLSDSQIAEFQKLQATAQDAATKVRSWTQLVGTLRESVGSTWSETFEILLGDFDSATTLFTNINNKLGPMISGMGEARNALLKGWADGGGRDMVIESLSNAFNALLALIEPVRKAFVNIFPPMTVDTLLSMTKGLLEFSKNLTISGKTASTLQTIFEGIFTGIRIGFEIFSGAIGLIGRILGALSGLIAPILGIAAAFIGPQVEGAKLLNTGEMISKFFTVLGDIILKPIEMLQKFAEWVGKGAEKLKEMDLFGFAADAKAAGKDLGILEVIGNAIVRVWDGVKNMFGKVGDFLKTVAGEVKNFFDDVGPGIEDGIKNIDWNVVLNLIQVGLFGGVILAVKKFVSGFTDSFKGLGGGGGGIIDTIKGVFGGLTDTLTEMQNNLKAKTLLTIAGAIAILTVSVIALSLIDSEALARALGAMAFMFTNLGVALNVFSKVAAGPGMAKLPIMAAGLVLLGAAIVVLSSAVTILSKLDWNELAKGLTGVTVLLGVLVVAAKGLNAVAPGLARTSVGLVLMAAAIKLLASAVTDLSGLSWADLAQGVIGVGVLMAGLTVMSNKINPASMIKASASMLIIGGALFVLSGALEKFGSIDVESMATGLIGMAGALFTVAIGMNMMPDGKGMVTSAISLTIVSAALLILGEALLKMSGLSWDDIGRVAVVLAGSLGIIAGGMALMSGALPGSAALIVVSAALVILADAFTEMSKLDWDDIGRLAVILAGALLIIAGGMYLMSGAILGAAALIVVAAALTVLVPPLILLSKMSWDEIGRGLAVLAGALVILAAGGLLLTVALPAFLGLGAAILLIGAGTLAAGVGLTMLAAGLVVLAAAGAAGAGAITLFGTAIINLIPMAMVALGNGIIAMAAVIANAGPQMTAAITTFLMSILNSINTLAPTIVSTLVNLVMMLVGALVQNVPKLVDAGMKLIVGILDGIGRNMGKIVDAGTKVITEFLDGIGRNIPKITTSAANLIISFVNGLATTIRTKQSEMEAAGKNLANAIIDGMTSGLGNGLKFVVNKAKEIATGALNAAKKLLGIASPSKEFFKIGAWSSEGMANGLVSLAGSVKNSAVVVAKTALNTMKSAMSNVASIVSNEMDLTPTIRPVLDLSEVKRNADLIPGLINSSALNLNIDKAYANASAIESNRQTAQTVATESVSSAGTPTVVYEQHITSPKAISAAETYRNTKNLLSITKGALPT